MAVTPVEIRHLELGRSFLGYRRATVDRHLEEIASSFEDVWRHRADLADRVETLEAEVERYRELENLLRTTLVSAERTAQEQLEKAMREAELIVSEAHAEARGVVRQAQSERERLEADSRRIEALLRSALTVLDERPGTLPRAAEAA